MSKLKENWQGFGGAIFDPWALILFCLISGMLVLSYLFAQSIMNNSSKLILPIFSLWLSLSSGILGSRIAKQLIDRKERKGLVAKGLSTIRGLKLLFTNLANLENRIKSYVSQLNDNQNTSDKLIVYCEEIIEKLMMMEEEVISSIEEWANVIPEARLKSHIEFFNDLKLALHFSEIEIETLYNQIVASNGQPKKLTQELTSRLKQEEKEMLQLREKVLERKKLLDKTILSGISTSVLKSGTASFDIFPELKTLSTFSSLPDSDEQTSFDLNLAEPVKESNKAESSSNNNK